VAEARRRQSAVEAQANAEIATAQQTRRAREAQLDAERAISDKQRELEQTRAANAALIAQAEAKKQDALAVQRTSELDATQIAQAKADAERVRSKRSRPQRRRRSAFARSRRDGESIRKVNEAIALAVRAISATSRSSCCRSSVRRSRCAGAGEAGHDRERW
jgi:flotillin